MEENTLSYDNIKCIFHSKGLNLEGKNQIHSIFQNLCLTYNEVMNLKIEFSFSQNSTNNHIVIDNLPIIVYGKNIIRKTNIPNFFKVLTGIDRELENNIIEIKMYYEMIEKAIFSDLELLLNYYNYLINLKRSNLASKIIKCIYSPLQTITSIFNDKKISKEISRILNVFNINECYDKIIQINYRIQTFLTSFGEPYYKNLIDRNLNSVDFAIYAAYKTQKSILECKFKNEEFEILKTFIDCFDDIVIKKQKLKNSLWSLTSSQYEEFCPKNNFFDSNFSKYTEIVNPAEEEMRKESYRKMIITGCFFGFIFFTKYYR